MKTIQVQEVLDKAKFNTFHKGILFWSALIIVFDGYDLIIYGTVLPKLMEVWQLSPLEAGSLASYALFGMMFGALFFGTIASKIGTKKSILACILLFSGFTFICGFVQNPTQFAICRFIAGLGIGGVFPNTVSLVTEYAPKKIRSLMTTIMISGYAIGGIMSALLGIFLIPEFGWRSVFAVGITPILLLPFIMRFMPDSLTYLVKKGKNTKAKSILVKIDPSLEIQKNDELALPEETVKVKGNFGNLFKNNRTQSSVMIWASFFLCLLMVYGLTSWIPKFMIKAGYDLGSSLSFLLVLNIGAIIGAVLGGYLGDRYDLRKTIIAFFSLGAVAMALLGLVKTSFILYGLMAIAGGATIGTQILLYTLAAQYYPATLRSTGVGWASGVGRIGAILGPILGGALMGFSLPFYQNFFAFAIAGALAALAIFFVQVKPQRKSKTKAVMNLETTS